MPLEIWCLTERKYIDKEHIQTSTFFQLTLSYLFWCRHDSRPVCCYLFDIHTRRRHHYLLLLALCTLNFWSEARQIDMHGEQHTLATASTCSLILGLPTVHKLYAPFKQYMTLSFGGHGGFGVASLISHYNFTVDKL